MNEENIHPAKKLPPHFTNLPKYSAFKPSLPLTVLTISLNKSAFMSLVMRLYELTPIKSCVGLKLKLE